MKKNLLLSLLALTIVSFFTSCKKEHIKGCIPQHAACLTPTFTGMAVYDQGVQVGMHIYDVYPSYANPGPEGIGAIHYYIDNSADWYTFDSLLVHTDGTDVMNGAVFTIAVPPTDPTFTITGIGTNDRCDCDPTVKTFTLTQNTTNSALSMKENKIFIGNSGF